MRVIFICFVVVSLLSSCTDNPGKKTTDSQTDTTVTTVPPGTTDDAALVEKSEKMKASIEAMSASMKKEEILLKNSKAKEAIRQKWMRMDVYRDSNGIIRRIKLYPHKDISERSEEFYFDQEQLFFVYISDKGVTSENNDEGKPGKEFHFSGNRLVKYDDTSGDKEINPAEEKKIYEAELPLEAKELLEIAKNK